MTDVPIGLLSIVGLLLGALVVLTVDFIRWRRRYRAWWVRDAAFRATIERWKRQNGARP